MTLQQKIYYNPTHEVGFGVFGDKDHDYNDDNFLILNPISIPSCSFLQNIEYVNSKRKEFFCSLMGWDKLSIIDILYKDYH